MIYTAIFQDSQSKIRRYRYTGAVGRKEAWVQAASLGEADNECLIALVPGDHPVYTYENTIHDLTDTQRHDLYEVEAEQVYQMT